MNIRHFNLTILNGQTTSAALDLGNATLVGVYIPASFTGTGVTFQTSRTVGGTFSPVKDGAGASVTKTVAAGDFVYLDPTLFAGCAAVKVVSNASEGADRVVTLAARIV